MKSLRRTPSTLGNWIHAIIRTLDAQGVDGTEIALQAGVGSRALHDPQVRVPLSAASELWRRAVAATGDPCFGLLVPRFVRPGTFGALAYGITSSCNLQAMFTRLTRYYRFISDAATVRFTVTAEKGSLEVDTRLQPGPTFEGIDAFMALAAGLARILSGSRRIVPTAVRLRRPRPVDAERFTRAFRCAVEFGADTNVMEFTRADLERPLPDGNAEVARQNDQIIAQYLAEMQQETLSVRVLQSLLETLPDGPSEAAIARRLGVSLSHLHRLLAEEGVNYRTLLNQAREDLARSYLRGGRYSIKEISFLLGFSDAATFSRAFRRWTGESPQRYAKNTAA